MIQLTESARSHFLQLLESQGGDALGVRISAIHAGSPKADVRLEFASLADLDGGEWSLDCGGLTLYVDGDSVAALDAAEIDYRHTATGGELVIRAPKLKGEAPAAEASLPDRVRWLIEQEINPQLAAHKGHVRLEEVSADGVVLLRFGGGCHGCGMVDVTLKQGIEKTLMAKVPGVTAVRDATDHSTGEAPYLAR